MYCSGSSPTLTGCTFTNNSASYGGGGMYNTGSPTLTDCTFANNSGRGMWNQSGSPTLTNCTFANNPNGGMYNYYSSPTLTNCTFEGNSASYGGGMRNIYGSPTLTNCTFTECCQVYPPNSFFDKGGNDYDSWCDECRADVDCDNEVNAADLGLLLSAWNTTEAQYDIDGDGVVGGGDLGNAPGARGAPAHSRWRRPFLNPNRPIEKQQHFQERPGCCSLASLSIPFKAGNEIRGRRPCAAHS